MLTKQEEDFLRYWSAERLRKKSFLKKLNLGLPLGVLIVAATLVNFLSGWYKKADMDLHANGSVIIVVLIAAIGIIVFVGLFSARHKWEQNEVYYAGLLKKKGMAPSGSDQEEKKV
jgi:hypothetical protein